MNKKAIIEQLNTELSKYLSLLKKIEEKNKKPPAGKLKCYKRNDKTYYYINNKYTPLKNLEQITSLADYDYHCKLLPTVKENIEKLDRMLKILDHDFDKPAKVFSSMHIGRQKLLKPDIITTQEFISNWIQTPYEHWNINDQQTKGNFITIKGERVRSKSEKIIADELTKFNIPYKYEYPLPLRDYGQNVIRRPDFIVLNVNSLEEIILEHLGLIDDDDYAVKNYEKINLYERNGYLIGKNLLIFHETKRSPLNVSIIDKYICEYLM